MQVVSAENEKNIADRMVAIALEGKRSVFFSRDRDLTNRMKARIEKHMDSIRPGLPETEMYFANGRYVVDNRGRKGYILIVSDLKEVLGVEVTEAFAAYGTDHNACSVLASREQKDLVGGTYERGLRWRSV